MNADEQLERFRADKQLERYRRALVEAIAELLYLKETRTGGHGAPVWATANEFEQERYRERARERIRILIEEV